MSNLRKYRPKGSEKFKVHPGLTINNRELRERVKNRSIQISQSGKIYSDDPLVNKTLRQPNVETERQWLKDNQNVSTLRERLSKRETELREQAKTKKNETDQKS